jgi:hypothetical protein|tara:strand:- start:500 stop:733 length:234 start_codon:yes stop_codon:yes gene_type:complete
LRSRDVVVSSEREYEESKHPPRKKKKKKPNKGRRNKKSKKSANVAFFSKQREADFRGILLASFVHFLEGSKEQAKLL